MELLNGIMYTVCGIAGFFGLVMISIAIYNLVRAKKCTKITADIYDVCQEYTARGFIWKDRIKFEWNGEKRNYITRARSMNRGCGKLDIYVDEKGRVIEPKKCIENIGIGVIAMICALVVLFL